MIKKLTLIIGLIAIFAFTHDHYISVFTMDYNAKKELLECSIKVYSDDLERMIVMKGGEELSLDEINDEEAISEILEEYLLEKVMCIQSENRRNLDYIGYEYSKEDTYVYFTLNNVDENPVQIRNSWLQDVYPGQVNIVHLNNGDYSQTEYFKKDISFLEFKMK